MLLNCPGTMLSVGCSDLSNICSLTHNLNDLQGFFSGYNLTYGMEEQVLRVMKTILGCSDKKMSRTREYLILQWQLEIAVSSRFLYETLYTNSPNLRIPSLLG